MNSAKMAHVCPTEVFEMARYGRINLASNAYKSEMIALTLQFHWVCMSQVLG